MRRNIDGLSAFVETAIKEAPGIWRDLQIPQEARL